MKFYEFVDSAPDIGKVVVIDGNDRALADRALALVLERTLAPDMRELNLERFSGAQWNGASAVLSAISAMPFLADRRVVVVSEAQALLTDPREELWAVAQSVPEGNTLVIVDVTTPGGGKRATPFGPRKDVKKLRIEATAGPDARRRFVRETLSDLGADADDRVVRELTAGNADLAAVRSHLSKLAIAGKKITYAQLASDNLTVEDPKFYKFAGAVVAGSPARAIAIANDVFFGDPKGAAIPLLTMLASELRLVWGVTQGHPLPEKQQWRAPELRPLARRIGERRAAAAHLRVVRAIESVVTGRAGDPAEHRALVDRLAVEISGISSAPRLRP